MDPNILQATTGKERVVTACAESQSTSRVPNRTPFLGVQSGIRAKMQCDKKSFLAAADASKQRNLMVVGGHSDNAVDLCGEVNPDEAPMSRQGTDYADEATEPIRRNSI